MTDAQSQYGIVKENDKGQSIVLFERSLTHPIEKVWAAIIEPEQRAQWAPGIHFEPELDGAYEIWFSEVCEGASHVSGTVNVFEPPRRLQLGSIAFELESIDGGTLLRFSDVLWFDGKSTRAEFANSVLGGWHVFLDRFCYFVDEGRALEPIPSEPDYANMDVPGRDLELT